METDDKVLIGNKIRKFRKEKGLTQEQLSEGICSDATVSLLERGKLIPNANTLQQLCDRLCISTLDLLAGHEDNLEVDTMLDIIKIHLQRNETAEAGHLINSLKERDLAKYQKQELVICDADWSSKTGDLDRTIELITELQEQLEQEREVDQHKLATLLDKLGTACFKKSNMLDAYSNYLRAYQIVSKFPEYDNLSAKVCYNLGNVCRMLGRDSEALIYVTLAKNFFEQTSNVPHLAHSLFALGIAHTHLKNLKDASTYLMKSLHLYETHDLLVLAEEVRYAYAYLVLSQTDPKEAVEHLLKSASEHENLGNIASKAYTYALISSIYMKQDNLEDAKTNLQKALSSFTEDQATTESKFVFVYQAYSEFLLLSGEIEQAVHYASLSAELFDKMGLDRYASDSLMVLKKAYEAKGEFQKGLSVSDRIIEKLQHTLNPSMR